MLDNADKADTLVCVATQQEIANLLPALELRPALVLSVATEVAVSQGWPVRLAGALGNTPLEVVPVTRAVDADPEALCNLVLTELRALGERRGRVAFAWGGGQKPQGVALWLAFTRLHAAEPGAGHLATYAEQHRRQLLLWTSPTTQETRPLLASPMLDQVLATAGLTLSRKSEPVCLWPDPDPLPAWLDEAAALFDQHAALRRACFEVSAGLGRASAEERAALDDAFKAHLPLDLWKALAWDFQRLPQASGAVKALSPGVVEQLIVALRSGLRKELTRSGAGALRVEAPTQPEVWAWLSALNPAWAAGEVSGEPVRLAPDPAPNFGRLFEFLLARRLQRWAARVEYRGELWMNVSYAESGRDHEVVAELDFLFLTPSGKLVTIDAKTFDRGPKEKRAQELTFLRLGGAFSKRYRCFPCFDADRGGEGVEAAPWMPGELVGARAQWEVERADPATERFAEKLLPYDETGLLEELLGKLVR